MDADIFISYARGMSKRRRRFLTRSASWASIVSGMRRALRQVRHGRKPLLRRSGTAKRYCASFRRTNPLTANMRSSRQKKYGKPLFPVLSSRAEPPAEIDLLTNRSQRIYVDPSLQTALPEILRALLPYVNRI